MTPDSYFDVTDEELEEMREAYEADDPKHPDFYDSLATIWDNREGK